MHAKRSPLIVGTAAIDPARVPVKDLINQIIDALIRRALAGDLSRASFETAFVKVRGSLPNGGVSPTDRPSYYKLFGFKNYGPKVLGDTPLRNMSFDRILDVREALKKLDFKSTIVLKETDHSHISTWTALLQDLLLKIEPTGSPPDQSCDILEAPEPNAAPPSIKTRSNVADIFLDLAIPDDFRIRTRRLFETEYVLSAMGEVPFGGRSAELKYLNTWLRDAGAAPFLLIDSRAGRGKTALLLEWIKTIKRSGASANGWQVAFTPISIRAGTNRPSVFLQGIAQRLGRILGEPPSTEGDNNPNALKRVVSQQLERLALGNTRTLLILDGLDETLRDDFDPTIFPPSLPPHMRIVISARWLVSDTDSTGWLRRLGWDRNIKADSMTLQPLGEGQTRQVLAKLGGALARLSKDPAILGRLHELTEGEPLLVRFYAEDLRKHAQSGTRITLSLLEGLKPGFESYFETWLANLSAQWEAENIKVDLNDIDAVFSILAYAYGPLEANDLISLLQCIYGNSGLVTEHRLLEPLRRFVIGNGLPGQGYVLCHPRLGEYLRDRRFRAPASQIKSGFAQWSLGQLEALNAGRIRPELASPYVVQYLRHHLVDSRALPHQWMQLVTNEWRLAWEHFEGGLRSFSEDVQTAWNTVRKASDKDIGGQWRCALVLSSIRSRGSNIPARLLVSAAHKDAISLHEAAILAESIKLPDEAIDCIAGLALLSALEPAQCTILLTTSLRRLSTLHPPRDRVRKLHSLLETLRPLYDSYFYTSNGKYGLDDKVLTSLKNISSAQRARRCDLMRTLVRSFEPFERFLALSAVNTATYPRDAGIVREAYEVALSITSPNQMVEALTDIGRFLPKNQADRALQIALETIPSISDLSDRATAMVSLAQELPKHRRALIDRAMKIPMSIPRLQERAKCFQFLSYYLSGRERAKAIKGAFDAATALRQPKKRAFSLSFLICFGPKSNSSTRKAKAAALSAVKSIKGSAGMQAWYLADLAKYLSGAERREALDLARKIKTVSDRAHALSGFARGSNAGDVQNELRNIVEDAKRLSEADERISSLTALRRFLSEEERETLLTDQLNSLRGFPFELGRLAGQLNKSQLARALRAIMKIGDSETLLPVLAALEKCKADSTPKGRHPQRRSVMKAPRGKADASAEELAEAQKVSREALQKMRALRTAGGINSLASQLVQSDYPEALALARSMPETIDRVRALAEIAVCLPPETRGIVVDEALMSLDPVREAAQSFGRGPFDRSLCWALEALTTASLPDQQGRLLDKLLQAASLHPRPEAARLMYASLEISVELGGSTAVTGMYNALANVMRWYP